MTFLWICLPDRIGKENSKFDLGEDINVPREISIYEKSQPFSL